MLKLILKNSKNFKLKKKDYFFFYFEFNPISDW